MWVEQIWSGWSKFGVGGPDVGKTVWRVADNLEKTLLCKFLFSLTFDDKSEGKTSIQRQKVDV